MEGTNDRGRMILPGDGGEKLFADELLVKLFPFRIHEIVCMEGAFLTEESKAPMTYRRPNLKHSASYI